MIFRLILFVLTGLAVFTLGTATALKVLQPMLETRRRKRLGLQNARECCSLCFERVDPEVDFHDGRKWSHAGCVRLLLNPEQEGMTR